MAIDPVTILSSTRAAAGRLSTLAAMGLGVTVLITALMTVAASPATAACVCRCVDGKARPVCSSGTDIPPLCNNTRCPLSTPKPSPTDVTKPKPAVKPGCKVRQVYDPQTGKHEWGQLCH